MSRINELGEKYKNLPALLNQYSDELKESAERLNPRGKKLEYSLSKNSAWLHYYDQRCIELHTLVKYFKSEEDRIRGGLFKTYKERPSIALSERDINKYIDAEEAYLNIHALLIEVEEVYELYKSVVSTLQGHNYSLSSITKLRIASLENIEL